MVTKEDISKALIVKGKKVFYNSLDVARFFDKEHKHVMRDIRNLIEQKPELGTIYFTESFYVDSQNKNQPCYLIESDSKESLLQFLYSTFSKKAIRKESAYRDKLAKLYNGKVEVKTPLGFIDVLTDDAIIEVKEFRGYLKALGQVTAYGYYYPNHRKICAFYDYRNNGNIDEVKGVFEILGIEILFLDTKEEVIVTDKNGDIIVNQLDLFNN